MTTHKHLDPMDEITASKLLYRQLRDHMKTAEGMTPSSERAQCLSRLEDAACWMGVDIVMKLNNIINED